MTGEHRKGRAERHINSKGRTVLIIENGAAGGAERRYTGTEPGFVAVKAILVDKTYPMAGGALDESRGEADIGRSVYREKEMSVAAAALSFVPTEKTRVVADAVTYAAQDVNAETLGDVRIMYIISLRPI